MTSTRPQPIRNIKLLGGRAGSLGILLLAGFFALGSTQTAHAVLMNSFGGAYGTITQPSGNTNFKFTSGYAINTSSTPGSLLAGAISDDLTVGLGSYTGVLNGVDGPVTLTPSFSVTLDATHKAVFTVSNARLKQSQIPFLSGFFGVGTITADVTLDVINTTPATWSAELTNFLTPGAKLFITYNGVLATTNGESGTAVLDVSPSASFTIAANTGPNIPEPSAIGLALSGFALLGGLGWREKRKRTRTAGSVSAPSISGSSTAERS